MIPMKKLYRVGIYCRLSTDDANNTSKAKSQIQADESVSIENQRELLSKFVMLNGWIETKTYIDDGYSGGNFQRPGFLEMLEDARKGVINLILVKDLSRLGRDFVEVGRYTDDIFPSLGCRFVSVLDCLDSEGDNTMLHFRSLMNDYHLRDLSTKIKTVLHSKKVNGQFASAFPSYGYRKGEKDRHRLEIDEYAAGVVKRIYEMRLSGMGYGKITAQLNQEKILPPRFYCYQNAGRDTSKVTTIWTERTVKLMLRNEEYTGNLLMNQSGTRSYKDKTTIAKPESEWIRIEGAHEAIIPREMWEAVQEINESCKKHRSVNPPCLDRLFSKKLVCADCGARMVANTERKSKGYLTEKTYISYSCSTHRRSGRSVCSWHKIYEITLSKIVIAEIRGHAQKLTLDEAGMIERIKKQSAKYDRQQLASLRQEISVLRKRVQELEDRAAKLYEDKIAGIISTGTFTTLIEKNEQERSAKAERLQELVSQTEVEDKQEKNVDAWAAIIRNYLNLETLDRETVDALIDYIEIGERSVVDGKRVQDIKIHYRFVGLID